MENLSWHFPEKKTHLPDGEWQQEPDKMQWLDKETGLPCLIARNSAGSLCGYVGVNSEHPFYGMDYDELGLLVHGGLSYSNTCSESICHLVEPGEDDNVWWLGFACASYDDLVPITVLANEEMFKRFPMKTWLAEFHPTYRNIEYVENECRGLAIQLKAIETHAPQHVE